MADRAQRRRANSSREAGREKLLDAARHLFRTRISHEVSRQDIAHEAGATPALMTYYFSNKSDLVLAATAPVVSDAIARVRTATMTQEPFEPQFRNIIGHFLDFARENAPLLDLFMEAMLESGDSEAKALVASCLDDLAQFFGKAVRSGVISRHAKPQFVLLALWGVCRLIGEDPLLPVDVTDAGASPEMVRAVQIDLVLQLFLHGISGDAQASGQNQPPAPTA